VNQSTSSQVTSKRKPLILVGTGIGVLIVIVAFFFTGGIELSPRDRDAIAEKFDELESRIARLEDTKKRIIFLQKQERAIKKRIAGYHEGGVSLEEQVQALSERMDRLEKAIAPSGSKKEAVSPGSREPAPVPGGRYHRVQAGDTLSKIAQKYGISVAQLCRLNNITPNQVIFPGERLMVAPPSNQ